jgi:hypothetical protein
MDGIATQDLPAHFMMQLDQHLQQTNILASRMTAILGRLDTRLSRLDKTVAPFGIQPLTKEARSASFCVFSSVVSG